MQFLAKRSKTTDEIRRVGLAALAAAINEARQEQPKKKNRRLTGVGALAAGAALYTAGRAAFTNRDSIREALGSNSDEPEDREDEQYDEDEEREEPVAEVDEDEEPEAEGDEPDEDEEPEEPEAEYDEPDEEEPEDEELEEEPEAEEHDEAESPRPPRRSRAPVRA
jgi:hypothetical protein